MACALLDEDIDNVLRGSRPKKFGFGRQIRRASGLVQARSLKLGQLTLNHSAPVLHLG